MTILTAILYVLATGLLLIGSSLSFEGKDADYFFISGTALFFLKSLIYLLKMEFRTKDWLHLVFQIHAPELQIIILTC